MKNQKVLEKIKKLFILADNNSSQEEAQAAILKAQELLVQNGMTIEDLEFEKADKKEIVVRNITGNQRNAWWKKSLMTIIGENFRCISYFVRTNNRSILRFCGLKQDVEIAIEVFNYACNSIEYSLKSYIKNYKAQFTDTFEFPFKNISAIKNNYIKGYLLGLNAKFKEQVNKNKWGLILVKDKEVEDYAKNKLNLKKEGETRLKIDNDLKVYNDGYQDGRKFDYNKKLIE